MKNRINNPSPEIKWQEIEITSKDFSSGYFRIMTRPNQLDGKLLQAASINGQKFQITVTIFVSGNYKYQGRKLTDHRVTIAIGKNEPIMQSAFTIPNKIELRNQLLFEVKFKNWIIMSYRLDGKELEYRPNEDIGTAEYKI